MKLTAKEITLLQFQIASERCVESFRTLYFLYYDSIINFGVQIIKSKEDAEEIYNDLMLKLWDKEKNLLDINNLSYYLFKSMKNRCLNKLKRSNAKLLDPIIDMDFINESRSNDPEERLLHAELLDSLREVIQLMPPKRKLVFILIKDYSLSYKETATILDISVNTIEGHMSAALKQIDAYLKSKSDF